MATHEPPVELVGKVTRPALIDNSQVEGPTASHDLAEASTFHGEWQEGGFAMLDRNDVEVGELVWKDSHAALQPLIMGMSNEDVWTLIRRFNKYVFKVVSIKNRPLSDLDMGMSEDEDTSPERLRAQLERLYMTVIIGLLISWKHLVRLRSWRERQRTSTFFAAYTVAWLIDLVTPILVVFFLILIIHPPLRATCFPPAPLSIIDSNTGGIKKPPAGVLSSLDSVTGAPEKHKGEAVEQEAHRFISSILKLLVGVTSAKDLDEEPGSPEKSTSLIDKIADAKSKLDGEEKSFDHDKTKEPIQKVVEDFEAPRVMYILSNLVDTWERFANALSPAPPFHGHLARLFIAVVLIPVLLVISFLSRDVIMRSLWAIVGFVIFGDPVIRPGLGFINKRYPNWRQSVQLRHTILKGVPTNAQLAITILRVGERNKTPLLPPPMSPDCPEVKVGVDAESLEHLGATKAEIRDAIEPDSDYDEPRPELEAKSKPMRRFLGAIKRTTKRGMHVVNVVDKLKISSGQEKDEDQLGLTQSTDQTPTGPLRFLARYEGQAGHVYITTTATTPAVSWRSNEKTLDAAWIVMIGDIEQVLKVGGLGWKSKAFVSWALNKDIVDGLVLTTKAGKEFHLTAVVKRDEMFNRLIAIGNQIWEVC